MKVKSCHFRLRMDEIQITKEKFEKSFEFFCAVSKKGAENKRKAEGGRGRDNHDKRI